MGSRRRGPQDHHRFIYNAGGNRIHDQNPAFRGIDGSPWPMHRVVAALIFSSESVLSPRQPLPSTVKICQKIPFDTEYHRILQTKLYYKYIGPFDFYMQLSFIDHGTLILTMRC